MFDDRGNPGGSYPNPAPKRELRLRYTRFFVFDGRGTLHPLPPGAARGEIKACNKIERANLPAAGAGYSGFFLTSRCQNSYPRDSEKLRKSAFSNI